MAPASNIPEVVGQVPFVPAPAVTPAPERYTVVVNDVPVKDLLFSVARDTQYNIDLHPGNHDVPYAYYMVGQSYYEQISDVGRDQEMTERAQASFTELIRRYPDSDYSRDASLKVDLIRDHLAGKEMEIGRYYQRHRLWLASINRFQTVVEQYQTTTHVPEALHRLTESYLALGMTEEAQASAAVLGYNFPGSAWYERAYALLQRQDLEPKKSEGSWFSRLF